MRAERLFRRLLRLFPAHFRGDFGDEMTDVFREQHRDAVRGGPMALLTLWWDTLRGIVTTAPREHLDLLRADVRYALRNLRRSPGFTAVAVIALAVGIGANTAVFTIVNGVLLRALPFQDPDRLVAIFEKVPGAPVDKFDFSAPDFEIVRDAARSYSGMFAYRNTKLELSGVAESQRVTGTYVSPGFLDVLGVSPVLGRGLTAEDDRANAKVVVLGYGLWTRLFGRDPGAIGRTIALDRQPYTVVGVMGERFEFPPRGAYNNGEPASLYMPIAFTPFERQAFGSMYNNTVVARLNPGVSVEQARDELATLVRPLTERYPPVLQQRMGLQLSLPMRPFLDEIVGESRRMILILMGAVGLVLLIGCADVANLMLTRTSSRQRELALRAAVGATPAHVVRQLLTEGFVLAALGGIVAVLLARVTMQALLGLAGEAMPRAEAIGFDGRVVTFAAALALATPLLFGVIPALRATLGSTLDALKEGSHAVTPGHGRQRLLGAIVVGQFALALMLSVGAGLLTRSFVRLSATHPGFQAEHLVTASVRLPAGRYAAGPDIKAFYQAAVDAARAIPGVTAAATTTDRPLQVLERRVFTPDATAVVIPTLNRSIAATWAAGSYFEALGIPLKRGRYFTDTDGRTGGRVVILSEMLARKLWPDQDPIGRQIKWGLEQSQTPWMTVVGVVGDVNQSALGTEPIAQTYEPVFQQPDAARISWFYRTVNLLVRSNRDPAAIVPALRAAIQQLDPELPLSDAAPVVTVVADSVKPQRFSTTVVAAFAIVALALAGIGIYGVLAHAVGQQTHEIGVRMALGARRSTVLWGVLRRALTLMAIGGAIGTLGALALTRVMAGLLYEVRPTDAATFAGSGMLLAVLAVLAGLVPAWRATRVDPLRALRTE
jgi:putative ABC transport system permease protein